MERKEKVEALVRARARAVTLETERRVLEDKMAVLGREIESAREKVRDLEREIGTL
jgi:hypothetical protein